MRSGVLNERLLRALLTGLICFVGITLVQSLYGFEQLLINMRGLAIVASVAMAVGLFSYWVSGWIIKILLTQSEKKEK